ncbi:MAG: hypothetical protein IT314_00740 [Anaerolineales bacterium]|nr:hypothetical protein [Anaerolineales bacterium]
MIYSPYAERPESFCKSFWFFVQSFGTAHSISDLLARIRTSYSFSLSERKLVRQEDMLHIEELDYEATFKKSISLEEVLPANHLARFAMDIVA